MRGSAPARAKRNGLVFVIGLLVLLLLLVAGSGLWRRINSVVPPCSDTAPRQAVVDSIRSHDDFIRRLSDRGARVDVERQALCSLEDSYFVRVSVPLPKLRGVQEVLDSRPENLGFAIALRFELRI